VTALTFGVVPGARVDTEHLARLEELPIDAIWMGGHVASPNPSPEVMMALATLAARTERVRVGTAILLLPLYAPAIVAKQIADLDNLTGGRVTLGIGIGGEYPGEFRACQVPLEQRGPRTDEAIPLLRRLWTGEAVTHDGRFYAMDDVRIHPAPAQPGGPPIVVAGRQPPAMRRAAQLGDGWMPYLYSPRRYAESVALIREHAERVGRTLERFEWCAFVFVGLDADGDRARDDAARFLGGTYRQDFRAMVDHVAAVGDVDDVTTSLQRFVDAGARHLILAPASPGPAATIERLFDDVVPRLRDAA
jgi:probable F420-dependent oxidoreductase